MGRMSEPKTTASDPVMEELARNLTELYNERGASYREIERALDYRYSTRALSDTQRMRDMIGRTAGRRLTYRPLVGRAS